MAGFRARSFPDEDGERRGGVVVRRDLAADRDRPVDDIPRRGVELHRELREVAAKDLPTLGVEYLEEVQEPGLRYVKPVGIVGGVGPVRHLRLDEKSVEIAPSVLFGSAFELHELKAADLNQERDLPRVVYAVA